MRNLVFLIIKYLLYPLFILIVLLNILILLRGLSHIIPGYGIFGENSESNAFFSFWIDIFAVAAATGMIIITSKSIINNSNENKKNRQIQQNLIIFQVENHNLNQFKESSIALCECYSYNNFITVCNKFIQDNKSPLEDIKLLMNNTTNKHKSFLMNILPKAPGMVKLIDEEGKIYKFYNDVLLDLEVVASYMQLSSEYIFSNMISDKHSSEILSQIIVENIHLLDKENPKKWLNKILNIRLDIIDSNYIGPLWDLISEIYLKEKTRIGKYLIEDGEES